MAWTGWAPNSTIRAPTRTCMSGLRTGGRQGFRLVGATRRAGSTPAGYVRHACTMTAPPAPQPLSHGKVLIAFSGLMLAILLAALDSTIVATALPTIVSEL